MKTFLWLGVVIALVLGLGATRALAEEPIVPQKKAVETFEKARDTRRQLSANLPRVDEAIEALKQQRIDFARLAEDKPRLEADLRLAEQDHDAARKAAQGAAPAERERLQARLRRAEINLNSVKSRWDSTQKRLTSPEREQVEKDLVVKQAERTKLQADLEAAENTINDFLNIEKPKQSFKLYMSAVFALLVGCVIIGFFFIAWLDDGVRRNIFAGHAGIQFVTLFSLVIAIILFGIIEILEGKELAALLGGLSGYILGRATTEHESAPVLPTNPSEGGHA